MSQILNSKNNLPIEIILHIFYKYKGLEHPLAKIIKDDINIINKNKCFYCNKNNCELIELPISYFYRNTIFYKETIICKNINNNFLICWECTN
jgi:hypothetical protein